MLLMGKSTISMAMFNSKLSVYQRVLVYLVQVWIMWDHPSISSKDSDVVRSLKTALKFYVLQNSPAANGDGLWEAYQYGDSMCN